MATTTPTHLRWCDPAVCATEPGGVEHRARPVTIPVGAYTIDVGVTRYVEHVPDGDSVSHGDQLTVTVTDQECVDPIGRPIRVAPGFTSSQARLFAAALTCVADQLDQVRD